MMKQHYRRAVWPQMSDCEQESVVLIRDTSASFYLEGVVSVRAGSSHQVASIAHITPRKIDLSS